MASLTIDKHVPRRSPYWYCCFTASDGRQIKKSTKQRIKPHPGEKNQAGRQRTPNDSKRDAWEICLAWEHAEQLASGGSATEKQIQAVLSETLARIGMKPIETPTVREWLEKWLRTKDGIVAKSTMHAYRQTVRDFLEFLGKRGDAKLESITPETIADFRDHLRAQGLAVGTVRNIIKKLLNSPFNLAWRTGKIPSNPCSFVQIESKRDQRARKTPRGIFTPEQVRKLVDAAEGDWKGLILGAYYTGGRLQDVANLRWLDVNEADRSVTFTQRKTGSDVTCPIHPTLWAHLETLDRNSSPWIFPTLANKDEGGRNGLSLKFVAIIEAAGIENTVVRKRAEGMKRSRSVRALTFHSLRHSFNSALANGGVPIELRQLLTGHADEVSNKRYTHHELDRLRNAVETIPHV